MSICASTVKRFSTSLAAMAFLAVSAVSTAPSFAQQTTATASISANATASASAAAEPVIFDLDKIRAELASQGEPENGLRQKVLLNEPLCTIVLLAFEKDGVKPDHTAPGMATITVIEGSVDFNVGGKTQKLDAGQVIVLQPNVNHDLKATEQSIVLVNISKGAGAASTPNAAAGRDH